MDVAEGAAVSGMGLGVVGEALSNIGVPKKRITRYEGAVKAGKFVLIYQGEPEEF
jgi:hypothetical protein